MKQHLSEEQFAAWIAGDRTGTAQEHVAGCPQCSSRTEAFSLVLQNFRGAAEEFATACRVPVHVPTPRPWWHPAPHWAVVAVAVMLSISVPLWRSHATERAAAEAAADEALLAQVDSQLSRAVPQTMEPLLTLVSDTQ
jgi:hypothetical protein